MSLLTVRHPWLLSLSDDLVRSGRWRRWVGSDARLSGFACLDDVLGLWRQYDRSDRCYLAVSALAALGSSRGGNEVEAALAVVVLLQDGIIARGRELWTGSQRHRPADDVIDEMLMGV